MRSRVFLHSVGSLLLGFLLITCAEVVPPPGGEPDKSGPYVFGSVPANGAVDVPRGRKIEITFSERVIRPDLTNPIFISPRPSVEPDIDWHSDRIVITFVDSFLVDQTYQISLSSELTDLRKNKIDSLTTVVFTTGPALADGRVAGTVLDNGSPQSGFAVAVYDQRDVTTDFVFDSLYPDYLTSTDKEGRFSIGYLPGGTYRAIAFKDVNRDQRFNPSREAFAVPDRLVRVGRIAGLENLRMVVSRQDTGSVEILSVSFTADRLLRVRLARPIKLDYLSENPNALTLYRAGDSTRLTAAASLLETSMESSSTLTFFLTAIEEGEYDLRLQYDPEREPLAHSGFSVTFSPDQRPPVLLGLSPNNRPYFADEIEIVAEFSEPLNIGMLTDDSFILFDNDSTRVTTQRIWRDDFHLELKPDSLGEGKRYRLALTEFEISDRAGNILGDSLVNFYFSTISADSVGSVRGIVSTTIQGEEETPIVLKLEQVGGDKQTYDAPILAGSFDASVPAGRYLLSGFLDRDRDGVYSPGSILPFKYAETVDVYPDTIAVRARFETTGIEFVID